MLHKYSTDVYMLKFKNWYWLDYHDTVKNNFQQGRIQDYNFACWKIRNEQIIYISFMIQKALQIYDKINRTRYCKEMIMHKS